MPLNLNSDNPVIVVKQDSLPVKVITGSSFYIFTGVTPTVVTDTVSGIYHTISIFTPSGKSGQDGTNGLSGKTPTLAFTGSGSTIVNYNVSGTSYQIEIYSPSGKSGQDGTNGTNGASGATPTLHFNGSGSTVVSTVVSGTTYDIHIYSPSGATGANGQDGQNGASGLTPTFIFLGSGTTVVNTQKLGTQYTLNIFSPSGATGAAGQNGTNGTNGASGLTPTLIFYGSGGTVVNYSQLGGIYNISILAPSGATGANGASGHTVVNYYTFIQSGATKIATGNTNTVTIYTPTGATLPTFLASRAVITDMSGQLTTANTTSTEIAYLFGVTSSVQTQLNNRSLTTHTHTSLTGLTITESQVINLPTDLGYLQTQINSLSVTQSSARIYIFQHEGSDIAGYEKLSPTVLSLTGATEVVPANNTTVLIDSYATPSGGLGVTGITSGIWTFHFHGSTNNATSSNMRFDVYKRVGAVETLLFQTALIPITSTVANTEYQIDEAHTAITGLNLTDRLVVKVYVVTTANRTITWTYGTSANNSFVQVPIPYITTVPWSSVSAKPQWLSGTTLGAFEAQHAHASLYQTKALTVTGITSMGTGTTIVHGTPVAANKVQVKSLKGAGSISISSDATTVTISGASSGGGSTLATIKQVTGTSYTALAADSSKILEFTASGATTITLPIGLTTGYQITIINYGGTTSLTKTFAAGSGATIKSRNSRLALNTQYDGATAYYRGSNVWVLIGDLN